MSIQGDAIVFFMIECARLRWAWKDIQTDITKPGSIGMGSHQSDSHQVEKVPTADSAVDHEGEMNVPTKPYEIPY